MRKFKTILCSLLSLCIIACPLASSITVSGAEDIDTLENKLDKLTKQSQEYQKTLDDTKNDISEKEAYSEALVGKIDVLSQKINATNQSINKLNTGIAQKKEQIDRNPVIMVEAPKNPKPNRKALQPGQIPDGLAEFGRRDLPGG